MPRPKVPQRHAVAAKARRRTPLGADNAAPYYVLVALLLFNSFRPDRLLPGGSAIAHLPTLLLVVLAAYWIQAPRKCLGNRQTLYVFLFVLVALTGTIFARNKAWAFELLRGFFLYVFLPYLFTVQFVDGPRRVQQYIRLFMYSSMFFVLIGISRSGLVSVPILSDENEFALFTNLLIPLAYFLGQSETEKRTKLLAYGIVVVLIAGTVASFSRGGLVGLAAVGAYIFLFTRRKTVAIGLLALFCLGLIALSSESYWADMATMFSEKGERGTGRDRLESWKAGWMMFLDHPIVGVGPRNFGMYLAEYYSGWEARAPTHMWGRVAHSLYFTLIPETGILGVGLFVMLLWSNYKDSRRIEVLSRWAPRVVVRTTGGTMEQQELLRSLAGLRHLSHGLMGAIVAFLVTGAFISVLWYHYIWMLTSFVVITGNAARSIELRLRTLEKLA